MNSLGDMMRDFSDMRSKMTKLKDSMPRIIGNEAVREVKKNFDKQGYYNGLTTSKWKNRTIATNKRYDSRKGVKGSVYSSKSPLLLQTRKLYNAIKYKANNVNVFIGINLNLVPYAQKMNEGYRPERIPARQYLPKNGEPIVNIEKAYKLRYDNELKKILKRYVK